MGDSYSFRQLVTATIANGAALSGSATTGAGADPIGLAAVLIPAAWTTAAMTFQVSNDDATYYDLCSDQGEYSIASGVVLVSRAIYLPSDVAFAMWRYWKVRSGISGTTVNQGAARSIGLIFRPR